MITEVFFLALLYLIVKHWICDFLLQPPYMWQNKHKYGHPGGIVHAGVNAVGSLPLVLFFGNVFPIIIEFISHYHIDWFKMNVNKHSGFTPQTKEFWWTLGGDQMLHYLIFIIMLVIWL